MHCAQGRQGGEQAQRQRLREVAEWTCEDVAKWLQRVVLLPHQQRDAKELQTAVSEQAIDGAALLLLEPHDLASLGITKVGHRKKIEAALAALRCSFAAELAVGDHAEAKSPPAATADSGAETATTHADDDASGGAVREVRDAVAVMLRRSPWVECLLKETVVLAVLRGCLLPASTEAAAAVGFRNDEEFLEWVEALFLLQRLRVDCREELRKGLLAHSSFTMRAQHVDAMLDDVQALHERLERLCEVRLSKCPQPPRLLRLATKLELSAKELKALEYILLCNIGKDFPPPTALNSNLDNRNLAHKVGVYAQMNNRELLDFFRPTRLHMKQGLFEVDDEYSTQFNSHFLVMSPEVMRALSGCSLSTDEFFKIDKTALAEVLMEEPNFCKEKEPTLTPKTQESGRRKKMKKKKKEKSGATAEEEEEAEGDQKEFDLEALLKEAGIEGVDGDDDEGGDGEDESEEGLGGGEGGEGSDEDHPAASDGEAPEGDDDSGDTFSIKPYTTDLEYLEDQFSLIETRLRMKKVDSEEDTSFRADQRKPESILRELRAKARSIEAKIEKRLAVTLMNAEWLPRIEQLVQLRGLDTFEKQVLLTLIAGMISTNVRKASSRRDDPIFRQSFDVGTLLGLFCDGLEQQIQYRTYFYKSSRMIREGIISLSDPPFRKGSDLLDSSVEIDRRLLDYIVGLDTELSELVDGSDLFSPKVKLDQVVLPADQKRLILDTINNFEAFKECCKAKGLEDRLTYGTGVCMLFFGPSGTGKTMKKLLVVNFPSLGTKNMSELMRLIFREAKLYDAIIFFDECESLFESRNQSKSVDLTSLLTEIEHYDGLVVMATNRPYDLDEAMYRRINLAIEFKLPDFNLRREIWRSHLPPDIAVAADVEWTKLAMNFELAGGFIKNAILSALTFAIARNGEDICIQQQDLEKGAKLQLRGHLQMVDFEQRVVPKKGVEDMVLTKQQQGCISDIISFEKARKVLFGHWGFESQMQQGTVVLFSGDHPGAGKRTAAEALGPFSSPFADSS
ncbi:ATPase, AAA domain containing protein [Acanthamoeba castellanii str. Neff]|uniref:ATPase, AAA domain containing protein n=1 Tax=Acanthamoeba castellanii (strain ATCC 30010 / Neff) TaxID=1257118 RepID=L8GGV5_ACACF|nr:ATPase, AAA domain containing protein [Acanthamoeba castellanii str. Neff]ELR12202.1 ATPase, AAA domain containing protein [Acanthamoeba castellanii str. Neff]